MANDVENERARIIAETRNKIDPEQERILAEAPSSMMANLLGAGVDDRGMDEQLYLETRRQFAEHRAVL